MRQKRLKVDEIIKILREIEGVRRASRYAGSIIYPSRSYIAGNASTARWSYPRLSG